VYLPSLNQSGNLVFPGLVRVGSKDVFRTFLWDRQAQQVTALTLPGMPAARDLTFEGGISGVINNRNEIVFGAILHDAAKNEHLGVLLRRPDGQLQAVALPGQELPDGRKLAHASQPSLNDAGVVAFMAQRQGDPIPTGAPESPETAYVWENGTLSSLVELGAEAPGGGKIAWIWYVDVNNRNRSVLLQAILDRPWRAGTSGPHGLYLAVEGKLVPVAVPGQEMPGGGQLKSVVGIRPGSLESVSWANERGQHTFIAEITEAGITRTALYMLEPDGQISLVLKSGTATELGLITRIGAAAGSRSVALNSKGQIAVPLKISGLPEMLVLLTPQGP
jgi:hypothetical protein